MPTRFVMPVMCTVMVPNCAGGSVVLSAAKSVTDVAKKRAVKIVNSLLIEQGVRGFRVQAGISLFVVSHTRERWRVTRTSAFVCKEENYGV